MNEYAFGHLPKGKAEVPRIKDKSPLVAGLELHFRFMEEPITAEICPCTFAVDFWKKLVKFKTKWDHLFRVGELRFNLKRELVRLAHEN